MRDSRGGNRGGDRGENNDDRANDNYRSGQRGGGRMGGGGRGGGYVGRGGRGGGRMGGGRGMGRGDRGGGYNSRRDNANDDHQEVELWDNTIAQNAEKLNQSQDDAWGDWDNEEYVGSLKDSKVFTTSNLQNQTVASVVSSGSGGGGGGGSELSAPPGLEHHLGTSVLGGAGSTAPGQPQQGSHLSALVGGAVTGNSLVDDSSVQQSSVSAVGVPSSAGVAMTMQYSAAVSSNPAQHHVGSRNLFSDGKLDELAGKQQVQSLSYSASAADTTFTNAATAAANLVQQHQQGAPQIKSSATLSAEQSQYFNSLSSQNAAAAASAQQSGVPTYAQSAGQYPTSYANVFATSAANVNNVNAGVPGVVDQSQQQQQAQVRRPPRAKLPPPSKIPSTAVEMPGDTLNNAGYLDVQFGGLDFGTDDSFDALPEKFNAAVNLEQQQQAQQDVVSGSGVNDYQGNKSSVQQQQSALTAGLQSSQLVSLSLYPHTKFYINTKFSFQRRMHLLLAMLNAVQLYNSSNSNKLVQP